MKRVSINLVIIILVLATAMVGCTKPAPAITPASNAQPPKTLDIGIATPLTGDLAFVGITLKDGTLLAIDDQNKQGGVTIDGQKYMLNPIIRDTKQDVVLGKSIAEELIYDKGVKVIIGPFISDAMGAQTVTEPNKVIDFVAAPIVDAMTGPQKPYTFFWSPTLGQLYVNTAAYIPKFYPEAKTVVSITCDIPTVPSLLNAIKVVFPQYGLQWLGVEKFAVGTKDLTPTIARALAKNPDIVDLCAAGAMAGVGSLCIRQLREAGFNGPIMVPYSPARSEVEEVVPKEYLHNIVICYCDVNSPIISEAYRDLYNRYEQEYHQEPDMPASHMYNAVKPFFEFLNGQNSMDTTAWMEGFAKYHWQGIYGFENYWVGKKVYGIDRCLFQCAWVSDYKDGKLVTEFTAPLPIDMYVEK